MTLTVRPNRLDRPMLSPMNCRVVCVDRHGRFRPCRCRHRSVCRFLRRHKVHTRTGHSVNTGLTRRVNKNVAPRRTLTGTRVRLSTGCPSFKFLVGRFCRNSLLCRVDAHRI